MVDITNPALKVSNFSKFCTIVFNELNYARTAPASYRKKLEKIKNNIDSDNILNIKGYGMQLKEGRTAMEEAMDFLDTSPKLAQLVYSPSISQSAEELLNVITLHDGMDMSDIENQNYDLEKRMNLFGAAYGELNELIDYGTFDPEYVIVNFIVCDGDPNRQERKIVFNPNIQYVGIASGLLPSEKICTVLNFSEYFFSPGEVIPEGLMEKIAVKKQPGYTQVVSKKETEEEEEEERMPMPPVVRKNSRKLYNEKIQNYKDFVEFEDSGKKTAEVKKNIQADEFNLPPGVSKIQFLEKKLKNSVTGKEENVVKKITYYEDGTTDTTIFKK